jgi:hypothetical protein
MISDRHRGLLNGAKDPIDGYPPLRLKELEKILNDDAKA